MMRMVIAAGLVALSCASCAQGAQPSGPPELNKGTALIETEDDTALLYVRVAETEEQRELAFETTSGLDDDEGLAFLYFEPTSEPFPMQGRIPLSVAFFDVDGKVSAVLDMCACHDLPTGCRTYDPGVTYLGTLAVAKGGFDRLGVAEGAVVEIVPGSE